MDIVITIPKNIRWEDYLKEIFAVQDGSQSMMFKVPRLPKRTSLGDRCYLCYQGKIVGFMLINWIGYRPAFDCTTTGVHWDAGNYVARTGSFFKAYDDIEYKGFQGFRYAPVEWRYTEFHEQRIQIN